MDEDTLFEKANQVAASCAAMNLRQASRAVSQLYDQIIRSTGLRGTQFSLLVAVYLAGPAPVTRLAELLVMDRTTLTRNLKPLEKQGLVKVKPGEDQRVRLVSLTDQGEDVLIEALPLWEEAQARVVNELGQERFAHLLQELAATAAVAQSE